MDQLAYPGTQTEWCVRTGNGVEIDVSGNLSIGSKGPSGLGKALHDSAAVPACLVDIRLSLLCLGPTGTGRRPT